MNKNLNIPFRDSFETDQKIGLRKVAALNAKVRPTIWQLVICINPVEVSLSIQNNWPYRGLSSSKWGCQEGTF